MDDGFDGCPCMRFEAGGDVFGFCTRANDAQTDGTAVFELEIDEGGEHRLTHRLTVHGLTAFDDAQGDDRIASTSKQTLGGQGDFKGSRNPRWVLQRHRRLQFGRAGTNHSKHVLDLVLVKRPANHTDVVSYANASCALIRSTVSTAATVMGSTSKFTLSPGFAEPSVVRASVSGIK